MHHCIQLNIYYDDINLLLYKYFRGFGSRSYIKQLELAVILNYYAFFLGISVFVMLFTSILRMFIFVSKPTLKFYL